MSSPGQSAAHLDASRLVRNIRRAALAMVVDAAHEAALREDRERRNRKARLLAAVVAFILAAVAFPHLSEAARAIGTATAVLLVGFGAAVRLATGQPSARRWRAR